MDLYLTGHVAIVTGGSRGIGKAIARGLALEGVDVVIVGRDGGALEATAREIASETGRSILPSIADTGDDSAVKAMVASALARFGRIDILVNCAARPAGQAKPPALADVTAEALWADVNVKVMGYIRVAREVAPSMIAAGRGRIINISGLAARSTGSIIGSIRNVGVSALTKNLADELGPHGVTAVCVHPGLTRTEKTPGVVRQRAQAEDKPEAEIEGQMAGGNLIGKLITAEEVADVVTFLASPRSMAINGDAVAAGGGTRGAIYY
ncbi:SDR family NAD(P)-dependent oxidoreductase [Lichenifustis flavocetrariae]|uniref:SDR family oxidoreductase n=1 Tax=Lichenifustis flavocetrariae TaxID=2949735 RepID=A0AA42CP52_9HYPH|nr:SDR family NAD(P)-dependent oxidoreductase [Lichenifustis flavocetrariae]MCW6510082.1 SDR family oxidoreductase [Lichenifustis flavocetrariae]